jgi:hypothetical protein
MLGTPPSTENAEGPYPTYVTQDSGKVVPVVQVYAYTKVSKTYQVIALSISSFFAVPWTFEIEF